MDKNKLEQNEQAINRLIKYSVYLWEIGLTLLQLRRTKNMINAISIISVPSKDALNDIEMELTHRRDELNKACKNLLLPILQGKNFGHVQLDRYFFGQTELKEGYALYQEIAGFSYSGNPTYTGRKYVLLLVDHTDEKLGKFRAGELLDFEIAKYFIGNLYIKSGKYRASSKTIFHSMHDTIGLYLKTRGMK